MPMRNNVEKYSSLTPREKEVLKFLIKGYTNKQISEKMYISSNTVRTMEVVSQTITVLFLT